MPNKTIKLKHAYTVLKMLFFKLKSVAISSHHCMTAINLYQQEYTKCRAAGIVSTTLAVMVRLFEQTITCDCFNCKCLTALNEAMLAASVYTRDGIPVNTQARNFIMIYA